MHEYEKKDFSVQACNLRKMLENPPFVSRGCLDAVSVPMSDFVTKANCTGRDVFGILELLVALQPSFGNGKE